jgi:non-lysosomal glucosylceramidase
LKVQKSFVSTLWNGEYFNYGMESATWDDVQADQLAGQWYANMTGLGDLVPRETQTSALKKIFAFNLMKSVMGRWVRQTECPPRAQS